MLCFDVHPQMFVRGGFNPANGAGRHGEISLPKTNRQVLILDPKTLVDFETKESDIRERCPGVGRAHSKPPELSMHA